VHLLVVAPPNAVCAAASTQHCQAGPRTGKSLIGQGKTVKILTVGKKGYDSCARILST
jgi:F-type H+-transporting ATPase subunit gamma